MAYKYKTLFLTEKDSQVEALAPVLGAAYKAKWQPAYNEKEKIAIVPLQGHLLKALEPQEYDASLGNFSEDAIYVFPEKMKFKDDPKKIDLINRAKQHIRDAEKIIIATDSDNEGAAIAMNIIEAAGGEDRIERMLPMGSTHYDELKKVVAHSDPIDYISMRNAGRTRAFIDWAEGMSLSRALTYYLGGRGKVKLNFGGVKTPIIYIVVERDLAFENHKVSYFWTVSGFIKRNDGTLIPVTIKHIDESEGDKKKYTNRFDSEAEALKAIEGLKKAELEIDKVNRKRSKTSPPQLYELAGLQSDMNKKYNIDLMGTMNIAQKLYDVPYSIQTYPRTDIPYLKEAEYVDVKPILQKLRDSGIIDAKLINSILGKEIPKRSSVFNDKEVVAHGAIVPTLGGDVRGAFSSLNDIEKKEFTLIATRYAANFMPDYEFIAVEGSTKDVDGYIVTFSENVPIQPGWREIYEPDINQRIANFKKEIPEDLKAGEKVSFLDENISRGETKPKPRFTQASLVLALEKVANLFPEDEEIKKYLGDGGIGTNATRAAIIDQLLNVEFNKGAPWLKMEGKNIVSTQKARDLIKILPVELVSPIKRAMLSKELRKIEKKETTEKAVVDSYRETVRNDIEIIKTLYEKEGAIAAGGESFSQKVEKPLIGVSCPVCKTGRIIEREKGFFCSNAKLQKEGDKWVNTGCTYAIWKDGLKKLGKGPITEKEVIKLLSDGHFIAKLTSAKSGKKYDGKVIVDEKYGIKVDFSDFGNSSNNEVDLSNATLLGRCPFCSGNIFGTDDRIVCENSKINHCKFSFPRNRMQKNGKNNLTNGEIESILNEGRVEVTLVSSKTGKPYSAYLVPDEQYGIKIEFKPR